MGYEFITIYWRDMIKFWRLKAMLFASLIQPILWLIFFGLAMSNYFDKNIPAIAIPQGIKSVDYLTFMSAGIISMTVLFTCLYSGIFLQLDKQNGLLKQMVASPMKRSHILFGITLGGITKSVLQVVIILAFGFIVGVRLFAGFEAASVILSLLGIMLFVFLFAMGLMFLSCAVAMKIESHEGVQAVITMMTLPLFFASNALYPLSSMPFAIRIISYANPLTYFINGVRYFGIGSDFYSSGTQYAISTNDMILSLLFLVIFNVVMYLLAIRTFQTARVT
jgi:ABC-2 type transport system permease protein